MQRTKNEKEIMLCKVEIAGHKKKLARLQDCYEDNKRNKRDYETDKANIKTVESSIKSLERKILSLRKEKVEPKVVLERKPKQTAEDIKKRRAELIECDVCGSVFRRSNKSKHNQTEKHKSNMQ